MKSSHSKGILANLTYEQAFELDRADKALAVAGQGSCQAASLSLILEFAKILAAAASPWTSTFQCRKPSLLLNTDTYFTLPNLDAPQSSRTTTLMAVSSSVLSHSLERKPLSLSEGKEHLMLEKACPHIRYHKKSGKVDCTQKPEKVGKDTLFMLP